MTRNVAVVTSNEERAAVRAALPKASIRATMSVRDGVAQILVVSIDDLTNARRFVKLERLFAQERRAVAMVVRAWSTSSARSGATSHTAMVSVYRVLSQLAFSERSRLRAAPPTYVATDPKALRRLVRARELGAEGSLIASVEVAGRDLLVWSCEPKLYRIGAAQIPALAKMDDDALAELELSESGNRIHWPCGDVDLNLDSLREVVDPDFRKANEDRARHQAAKYGRAIRALREDKGLTQKSIGGLSDREVRRLESASVMPHASTLRKLAAAHGMSVKGYVDELARRAGKGT